MTRQNKKTETKQVCNTSIAENIGLITETSWEVCNKIGGIYAVLSTKARQLKEQFSDALVFIGPDVWSSENPLHISKRKRQFLNPRLQNSSSRGA